MGGREWGGEDDDTLRTSLGVHDRGLGGIVDRDIRGDFCFEEALSSGSGFELEPIGHTSPPVLPSSWEAA